MMRITRYLAEGCTHPSLDIGASVAVVVNTSLLVAEECLFVFDLKR